MANDTLPLALVAVAFVFGSFIALWFVSQRQRDASLVDVWFAPCVAGVALIGLWSGAGALPRRVLVAALVGLWALRLGGYLLWRNWGREDARYARLRQHVQAQGRSFGWYSFTRINLYQAALVTAMVAPLVVAQSARTPVQLGTLALLGAALALAGIVIEGIADAQLARFKADPANADRVLDHGLWRYSRHPNYFGEACAWWGFWLVACEVPWGWATVFSPLVVTGSITGMMGKELVERRMRKKRPGYDDYVRRTSGFLPWPPRR